MPTHRDPVRIKTAQPLTAAPTLADRLLDEGLMSIVAAAAAEGIKIVAKTALRWKIYGAHGAKLEAVRIKGRWLTSRAALRRFIAAQQPDAAPAVAVLDQSAADRVLAAHGLGREQEGKS